MKKRNTLLVILVAAIALMAVGCGGNNSKKAEATISDKLLGECEADPTLVAQINHTRFSEQGLLGIEYLDPFTTKSNEKVKDSSGLSEESSLNDIRFAGWGDEDWGNNNYIRSIRLYIDAINVGLVKDEILEKHKEKLKGDFVIVDLEEFMAGGLYYYVVFVDNPDTVFGFWVYSFATYDPLGVSGYEVRHADVRAENYPLTTEEIKAELAKNPTILLW